MEREYFQSAVNKYQNMVFRIALHSMGQITDAEDVVQEVFLRLYTCTVTFESMEHLRYWLIRVTVNVCRDMLKNPWRRRISLDNVPEPAFEQPEQLELYQEVMMLPEKYRVVLVLFYYEELSTKEIGEILGLRQSAVTTRLSRARALLKQRLKGVWKDE